MLCKDAPFSSVAPFRRHPIIHQCIRDVRLHQILPSKIRELKKYYIEMADFLVACVEHGSPNFGSAFCETPGFEDWDGTPVQSACATTKRNSQFILPTRWDCLLLFRDRETGMCMYFCMCVCLCQCSEFENCHFFYQNVHLSSVFVDQENAILWAGQMHWERWWKKEKLWWVPTSRSDLYKEFP